MITQVKETELGDIYKVTRSDGTVQSVPKVSGNRHYKEVQDWIADGSGVVEEFEAPPKPDPTKGTAKLSLGSVTVANTNVTSQSLIILTALGNSLNIGSVYVLRDDGQFTIKSSNELDDREVVWLIL